MLAALISLLNHNTSTSIGILIPHYQYSVHVLLLLIVGQFVASSTDADIRTADESCRRYVIARTIEVVTCRECISTGVVSS